MQTTNDPARIRASELADVNARLRRQSAIVDDDALTNELFDAAQVVEQRERAGLTAGRLADRAPAARGTRPRRALRLRTLHRLR